MSETNMNIHDFSSTEQANDWKIAFERERIARQQAERMLDEKTREVQNSLDVMQFHFDEVTARNKELQVLSSIASITHQRLGFHQCLELLLTSVSGIVPCIYAQAYIQNPDNKNYWIAFGAARECVPIPDFLRSTLNNYDAPLQAHHQSTISKKDVTTSRFDTADNEFIENLLNGGIRTLITLPLIQNDACVAIAEFGFLQKEIRETEYIKIMQTAAHQIGIAMERREQEDQLTSNFHELKKAHEELKNAKNQLVQSEKMASIGQLSAGIAHEINNPVGFVLSNFGSLKDYLNTLGDISCEARKLLNKAPTMNTEETIEASSTFNKNWEKQDIDFILTDLSTLMKDCEGGLIRVREIVASLKDFSRADNDQFEQVKLDELIEKSIRLVWNEIKYSSKLECSYETLPEIICNARQISQVVVNLIVNASQAMKDTGTITVSLKQEGEFARIDIEDTGSGIPENLLSRIFEPFFTTKPVGVGTGLGLSIAYGILQAHNGRIEVKSTVDVGTCFSLFIPMHHDASILKKTD